MASLSVGSAPKLLLPGTFDLQANWSHVYFIWTSSANHMSSMELFSNNGCKQTLQEDRPQHDTPLLTFGINSKNYWPLIAQHLPSTLLLLYNCTHSAQRHSESSPQKTLYLSFSQGCTATRNIFLILDALQILSRVKNSSFFLKMKGSFLCIFTHHTKSCVSDLLLPRRETITMAHSFSW